MRKSLLFKLLLFICCSAVSLLSWYLVLILVAPTISFMGVSDKELGSPETLFALFCLAFPFILFAFVAYLFRKSFGAFSALFACSPLLLIFVIFLIFQYQVYRDAAKNRSDHPENGTIETTYIDNQQGKLRQIITYKDYKINGERIIYCQNGNIFAKGNYEDNKEIGEHFKRDWGCNSEGEFTLTFYQPAGETTDVKKYEADQLVYHYFKDSDYKNNGTSTALSYGWNAEKTKLFLAGEIITMNFGEKQINRKYDENEKLISEKVLPEVSASPTSKTVK